MCLEFGIVSMPFELKEMQFWRKVNDLWKTRRQEASRTPTGPREEDQDQGMKGWMKRARRSGRGQWGRAWEA